MAVEKLFDRLPPHSIEAEMALLGSMILEPAVTGEVIEIVRSPEAFYQPAHGAIFQTLVKLYDTRQSADLVQLTDALASSGALEDVGGQEYLLELAEAVPSAASALHYARIVSERHRLRRLIDAAGQILHNAFVTQPDDGPGGEGAQPVIDEAERLIFEIAEEAQSGDAAKLTELLHEAIDILERREGKTVTGLSTGFYDLDELTSGLQEGEMIVLAARPSMGKTALMLNLAEQVALGGRHGGGVPVGVFSLEMSRQSIAQRLLCARSGVDSHLVRSGKLSKDHFAKLIEACGELEEAKLFIDDTPGLSVLGLRARARRMAARHGVRCIFIDYLQLLTAPGKDRESRQVEVSAISRGVKALARELSIPVVVLSQLNRGAESREGHRPRMSDLRESGSIEQDADVVMLLHREAYYHQGDDEWAEQHPDEANTAEVIVAKQRNGPTGLVKLVWDARTTRFYDYDWSTSASRAPTAAGAAAPPVDDLPI
ncbi:MAG: replicative DNA helicase [Planctomycetota bacterium]|nr:MAG: replicative DNA helicase [Planctomycetota bacterium]